MTFKDAPVSYISKNMYSFIETSSFMKKKIILLLEDEIITAAKRKAKRRGISISQMFEESIRIGGLGKIETESQRAEKRLLNRLQEAESIADKDDKKLIKEHVKRKFTFCVS